MDKRKLRITSRVFDVVKVHFPETKLRVHRRIEQECSKENISVKEAIFLATCLEAKR